MSQKQEKPPARCTDCKEATPGAWLNDAGECPWCASTERRNLTVLAGEEVTEPRDCERCGVAILSLPYLCPCNRKTRERLDWAEQDVEMQERPELAGGSGT